MDRRQVLGATAFALGGAMLAQPVEAASLETWVIIQDPYDSDGEKGPDELATGAFLKATKSRKAKVQKKKNKLWGAEGVVDISETDPNRGTFTGTLLAQVPPYTHAANAIPVVKYKSLPFEAKQCLIALNEIVDVIAALLARNRDALDQIDIAREELSDAERVIHNSTTISADEKNLIQEMIQDSRQHLNETQSMIENLPRNPTPQQLIEVGKKIILAATPMQVAWIILRPKA